MNEQTVIDLAANTIWVTMEVAAPALIAALVTGLIIAIIQAATQINEQTVAFLPKIIVMMGAMVICGPWILQTIMTFTINLFKEIPNMAP